MRIGFSVVAVFMLAGCMHYYPTAVSTTSINGKYEQPIRIETGEAESLYILGFIGPFGDDSLKAAIEDAKKKSSADTLVNVFVDRKMENYILFQKVKTIVSGTLIRYEDQNGKRPPLMITARPNQTSANPTGYAMSPKSKKESVVTFCTIYGKDLEVAIINGKGSHLYSLLAILEGSTPDGSASIQKLQEVRNEWQLRHSGSTEEDYKALGNDINRAFNVGD